MLIEQTTALVPGGSCNCRDELGAVWQGVLTVHLRVPPRSIVHSPSWPSACAAVRLCSQLSCSPSKGCLCMAVSHLVQPCCCSQKCPMASRRCHPTACNAKREQAAPPVSPHPNTAACVAGDSQEGLPGAPRLFAARSEYTAHSPLWLLPLL